MTMISPYSYAKSIEKCSYDELIQERGRLIESILRLEAEAKGTLPRREQICPSDLTVYSCNLQYLAELMKLMASRCKELEWVEPKLDAMERWRRAREEQQKAILVWEKADEERLRVLAEERRVYLEEQENLEGNQVKGIERQSNHLISMVTRLFSK